MPEIQLNYIKYNLTESTPNTGTLTADTARVRLFYQYPTTINANGANYGYELGPCNYSSAKNGYNYYTSDYTVKTDSAIDSMYYPGDNQYYWLASPTALNASFVLGVYYDDGGYVYYGYYRTTTAICPLVSLQSTVSLQLQ